MVRTIQVAQKSIKHNSNKWKNLRNKELKNLEDSSTKSFKDTKLKSISNPGGHKEGRASFPTQS